MELYRSVTTTVILTEEQMVLNSSSPVLPGAIGDCGDEEGLGIGAEVKGSSGGPLNAVVI